MTAPETNTAADNQNIRVSQCIICGKRIEQKPTKAGHFTKGKKYCSRRCAKKAEGVEGSKIRDAVNAKQRIKSPNKTKQPKKITDEFIAGVAARIQRGAPLQYALGSADTDIKNRTTPATLKRWLALGRRDNLIRNLLTEIADGEITRPEALAEIEKAGETPESAVMLLDGKIPPRHPKLGELAAAVDKAQDDFVNIQLDKIHRASDQTNPNGNWRAALALLCARMPEQFSEKRFITDGKEDIKPADIAAAANLIGDIIRAKAGEELPPAPPPAHDFTKTPHASRGKPRRRRHRPTTE